jgi:hypothetical protein
MGERGAGSGGQAEGGHEGPLFDWSWVGVVYCRCWSTARGTCAFCLQAGRQHQRSSRWQVDGTAARYISVGTGASNWASWGGSTPEGGSQVDSNVGSGALALFAVGGVGRRRAPQQTQRSPCSCSKTKLAVNLASTSRPTRTHRNTTQGAQRVSAHNTRYFGCTWK